MFSNSYMFVALLVPKVTATVLPLPAPFFKSVVYLTFLLLVFLFAQLSPEAVCGTMLVPAAVMGVRSMFPPPIFS